MKDAGRNAKQGFKDAAAQGKEAVKQATQVGDAEGGQDIDDIRHAPLVWHIPPPLHLQLTACYLPINAPHNPSFHPPTVQ